MRQVLWLYDPHWQYARVWQRQRAVLYHPSCDGALFNCLPWTLCFVMQTNHGGKANNSLSAVSKTLREQQVAPRGLHQCAVSGFWILARTYKGASEHGSNAREPSPVDRHGKAGSRVVVCFSTPQAD